ncbi:MAG: chromosomal replication initiator protein DnaA [Candidatus Pacebacteria bacterium]|nr:chromosomal replication initiator protein DnaA [Candidatus Paceibacterota bacterium]
MIKKNIWQTVLAEIEINISKINFETWFKNTDIISIQNNVVKIGVPNNFTKEWLEEKYSKDILNILRKSNQNIQKIEYIIHQFNKQNSYSINNTTLTQNNQQIDFKQTSIRQKANLNKKYTFSNFVVGPSNEMSQAAALAVAKNPGDVQYNPLFIYGKVGLGKTHLLQAIGNQIIEDYPIKRVKYISAIDFISKIVNSILNRTINQLKLQYKDIDVFIVDDVQFFIGKEKGQEEFFHIFNFLYQQNRQIVLSSDRPPKMIPTISERLKSRFEGGMTVDIEIPEIETRIAILKDKIKQKSIIISEEVLEYIAINVQQNIRELEGALNKIYFYSKQKNTIISVIEAKKILEKITQKPKKNISSKTIIDKVCSFYNINNKNVLTSSSRRQEIVKPRQVAMYLLRKELNISYTSIGKIFNGKDHTTVLYSYLKIKKEIENNRDLFEEIELIKQKIYSE